VQLSLQGVDGIIAQASTDTVVEGEPTEPTEPTETLSENRQVE
jgi:hypothetical protein